MMATNVTHTNNITIVPGDIHNDGDTHDSDGGNTTTSTGQATSPGITNFNLQIKQNRIPEFFSQKGKDTISAMDFIRKLEDLAKTNR
jgi:hypothetical protein